MVEPKEDELLELIEDLEWYWGFKVLHHCFTDASFRTPTDSPSLVGVKRETTVTDTDLILKFLTLLVQIKHQLTLLIICQ